MSSLKKIIKIRTWKSIKCGHQNIDDNTVDIERVLTY